MLSVSYDGKTLPDGAGAQLQRIIGIYALARFFRLGYRHTGLKEVMVHPNDGVETAEHYRNYLEDINKLIPYENMRMSKKPDLSLKIKHLGVRQFLRLYFRYRFSNQHIHLEILQPDHVINKFPFIFRYFRIVNPSKISKVSGRITIHVRQSGPDATFILKGEKFTRNLPADYYLQGLYHIKELVGQTEFDKTEIHIVTDEPNTKMKFVPFSNQTDLWELAGYPLNQNSIEFEGGSITDYILGVFPNAVVSRGGSPSAAIKLLASGEYLIMSRSSLSFVSAVLSSSVLRIKPTGYQFPEF